jgi:hypothetical protein
VAEIRAADKVKELWPGASVKPVDVVHKEEPWAYIVWLPGQSDDPTNRPRSARTKLEAWQNALDWMLCQKCGGSGTYAHNTCAWCNGHGYVGSIEVAGP